MPPHPNDRSDPPAEAAMGEGMLSFDPEEAFDHLYEQHAVAIERWIRRLGGPTIEVEDLMHDVFVVALRKRAEFRGDASLATWLFRITQTLVRKRRFRTRLRGYLDFRHFKETETLATPTPTPLEEIERRQNYTRLYAALDRLPEKYRTPVILCDLEGLPAAQTGSLLGISENATWVRVHRGRAMLLERLSPGKRVAP